MAEIIWRMLDKEGKIYICFFPNNTEVQGYLCRGSVMGREGIQTSFHKNGKLNLFFSRRDIEIDGISCKGTVFHPIGLHDNGKLRNCTLTKTTIIKVLAFIGISETIRLHTSSQSTRIIP